MSKRTEKPLYKKWSDMKSRCSNPNVESFRYYGGKGISVCKLWINDFDEFEKWSLLNGYKPGLSLDRKKNNVDYEPSNCRWTNATIQARNCSKRKDNTSGYKGVSKKKNGRFLSKIYINRKGIYIGTFDTAKEAGDAYNNYIDAHKLEHLKN